MPTKGVRTRARIIAAAAPVFNTKGFAGASMTDILQAAGLEKGGLYRHFASKDELALAAFAYAVRLLEQRHDATQVGRTTALERLEACVDVVAGSIREPPLRGGCPILNTAIESDDTHVALREQAALAMRRWQDRIASIVDDGLTSGELRADTNPATVATVLTATLEGAVMVASLLRDPSQMDAIAAHLRNWLATLRRADRTRRIS